MEGGRCGLHLRQVGECSRQCPPAARDGADEDSLRELDPENQTWREIRAAETLSLRF